MSVVFSKEMIDEISARKKSAEASGMRETRLDFRNHILLLPKGVSTDDIKRLSDAARFGGKVVTNKDWLID